MLLNELKDLIRLVISERNKTKYPVHRVFDFDDTLVFTDAKVHIKSKEHGHHKMSLKPAEYAVYEPHEDDDFDYGDFNKLINPKEITRILNIFRKIIDKYGPSGASILTARSASEPVRQFLKDKGFPEGIEIIALGDSNPQKKAEWLSNKIKFDGLKQIEFFDDSYKNIAAAKELKKMHPECRIIVRHIKHKH